MQPLLQRWSVCDCVYDCENGHDRRNRIHRVRDGDVRDRGHGRRSSLRACVRDYGHGRRSNLRDDVHDRDRGRRNRIRRVRGDDVHDCGRGRRNSLRGDVHGRDRDRRNRIRDCVRDYGRDRRNRIHRVHDGDVRGYGRDRRNKCDHVHESGHVHMNKSSFLRSYLSPLFVHQMHDAHFKYFFNVIVVKTVKYVFADLS